MILEGFSNGGKIDNDVNIIAAEDSSISDACQFEQPGRLTSPGGQDDFFSSFGGFRLRPMLILNTRCLGGPCEKNLFRDSTGKKVKVVTAFCEVVVTVDRIGPGTCCRVHA